MDAVAFTAAGFIAADQDSRSGALQAWVCDRCAALTLTDGHDRHRRWHELNE